jgi:hypothetical protein
MSSITKFLAEARKAIVAIIGLAGTAIADGLVPSGDVKWVTIVVSALTAITVYLVPNKAPTPPAPTPAAKVAKK